MKKVLIYTIHNDYMSIDEAIAKYKDGYDVYIVGCDNSVNICGFYNPRGASVICSLCKQAMKHEIDKLIRINKNRFHYVSSSSLITNKIRKDSENIKFEYNNTQELKNIVYKGVEIGFAAFSTFVSTTRNVMPTYNEFLKEYLDDIMRKEIQLTEALEYYIDKINPDLIIFHNGRMSNCKPIYGLAKAKGIDYIATERIPSIGKAKMDNFYNDIPHSYKAIHSKIENKWANAGDDKENIGKLFYENRYHSKPAGDIIYAKDQQLGKLPANFDLTKRNIIIFNSSEDEYFSISKEFDENVLFPNQYIALKTLFDHYKNNDDIHFYLRIHPNLAKVPYKSHTMLYDLLYDNVTIISPTSPISSYTLMENAEKIVVFDSTMGLESSYWGKPVIALNICFYSNHGIIYEPNNVEELFTLIDNVNLNNRKAEKTVWYKLAYRLMGYVGDEQKYYDCEEYYMNLPFIEKNTIHVYSKFKLLGSSYLYTLTYNILKKLAENGIISKYSHKYMRNTI